MNASGASQKNGVFNVILGKNGPFSFEKGPFSFEKGPLSLKKGPLF